MAWTASAISLGVLLSAGVASIVAVATLRERPDPLAWPVAAFMGAVGFWSFAAALSFASQNLAQVDFWRRVVGPAGSLAAVAFLIVALRYAGDDEWLPSWTEPALVAPAIAFGVAVWTNRYHHLVWESASVRQTYGVSVLVIEQGPLYWPVFGYSWLVTIVGLFVLGRVAVRSGPIYRKQATLLFLGGLVPLAGNVAFQLDLLPLPPIDLTPTMLVVSGLTFALALFHFDLLDVRPVARQRLVESLDDAIVVVGPDEEVRDFNPTADRLLDDLERHRPAEEVLPAAATTDSGELVLRDGDEERTFRTRTTPLEDASGNRVGRIYYLNDVSQIVEREQRVSVLNRVLRHNIRNELTVAMGNLELLSESEADSERVATVNESIQRVVQFAEKARSIERTLREENSSSLVAVEPVVDRVVDAAQQRFPAARVTVSPGSSAVAAEETVVRVVDEELLARCLWELVENAVVHNDADRPRISIDVEPDGDRVRIHVTDNGPGIPSDEQEILQVQPESSLEHGSGLGLWLVQWTVSLSNGALRFDADSEENTVTVALPAGDPEARETDKAETGEAERDESEPGDAASDEPESDESVPGSADESSGRASPDGGSTDGSAAESGADGSAADGDPPPTE